MTVLNEGCRVYLETSMWIKYSSKKYENFAVKCETGIKTNVETNVKMMTVYGVGRNITITDLIKCKVKTSHIYFFKFS